MASSVDLQYVGPHGAVIVPMPLGGETTVNWGDTFTTSEEHAYALLAQPSNWKRTPTKRAAAKEE